jgi:sec-independent protein translocase protein TatA
LVVLSGLESPFHLILILLALLLLFGAKRLPEMGRSLGNGLREFKDSVSGTEEAPANTEPTEPAALAAPPAVAARGHQDPATVKAALESMSEDDRQAVIASLSQAPSSPDAPRADGL